MIAVRRVALAPADTPAAGRGPSRNPTPRVVTGLVVGLALALTGCGSHDEPAGAAAPARGDPAPGSGQAGGPASSPGQTATASPGGGASGPASDSQAAAAGVVTAYFAEINSASRASRVADVTATALPGCQACALDVGVTRGFQQRGLRADADPYEITEVTAQPRQGVVVTVTFTATARTVDLLDQAGRRVDAAAGVPARAGTAELALTGGGWLIQTIRYARR